MQNGFGFKEHEIIDMVKNKAAELSGVNPDVLKATVSAWQGTLTIIVFHTDHKKDLKMKDVE